LIKIGVPVAINHNSNTCQPEYNIAQWD